MALIPRTTPARKLEAGLKKDSFILISQTGSHKTYVKGDRVVTLPYHHSG